MDATEQLWPALREHRNLADWEAAVKAYVRLQRDTVKHLDTLWELGCVDRRLETLPAQIDLLLADAELLKLLEASEVEQFGDIASRLKALAAELATYQLPATLVHGDLHPGNIAVMPVGFFFYDWTDASIAHPFFDLITILDEVSTLPEAAQAAARLQAAYLDAWTDYESPERVLYAWTLAEPLAALHQVISYRNIYSILEHSREI